MPKKDGPGALPKRGYCWFFAAVAAVLLLALFASWMFCSPLEGVGKAAARRLDSGWSYLTEDGFVPLCELPCSADAAGDSLTLRRSLAQEECDPAFVLTVKTRYASLRVWAGERLVYESPQGEAHALGSMWHFIPAAKLSGASEVRLEFCAYDGRTAWQVESVLFDTPGAVQHALLTENAGYLFFCIICLLLTLVFLLCTVVLARWKSPSWRALAALALFVFLSGAWILLDSKITTLWGGNYALSYFLSYAAFYLLPAPCLLYVRLMLEDCRRPLNALIAAVLANAGVCLALHMAGAVKIRSTAVVVHALILLSIPVITRAFWCSVVRRREAQLRFTFAGMMAVYAFGAISIGLFYTGALHNANNTALYIVGLSLLLAGMTADALASFGRFWRQMESAERYRRLAVEDGMTALGNRNAFQIYRASLLEHPPEHLAFVAFDVDNLKKINDGLGHHVGDQALYTAALCIRTVFAPVGRCYRFGGDEFVVVITGGAAERIPALLTRFAREVEARWHALPEDTGVSYGWACGSCPPERPLTEEKFARLLEEADQSLYRMKQLKKAGEAEQAEG